MPSKGVEKRAFERFPIPTLIDLELDNKTYHHEFSTNISETGIYIETDRLLPVGTKASMRFAVPHLDWVFEIQSIVMWIVQVTSDQKLDGKKDGMGFSFLSMDATDKEKFHTYMKNFKIKDLEL